MRIMPRARRVAIALPAAPFMALLLSATAHAASGAPAPPPAGGAPVGQVIGASVAGVLLTLGLLTIGMRYRAGALPALDAIARPFSWLLRVPGWAALPAALATGSLILAGLGFYWDVAVHIDRGRDPGPFGTPAHFPILIGLFGLFAAGWLALVMARGEDAARTGVRLTRTWIVPTSGLVMMACGGFALVGFPLDDVWHTIFGQDVTLWGPTHLIMLTGAQLLIVTILALIGEGRAAARQAAPGSRGSAERRAGSVGRWVVAVSGAGGILAGLTIYQAEFGFGVPQYNLLFQPALLAFTGGLALVFARAVAGRGGAFAAVAFNLLVSGLFAVFVGPVMGEVTPHFSTYLPAAICVEVAALVVPPRRIWSFAALAGLLVGTAGTIGEWGWTHIWMPISWPAHFVGSAVSVGIAAGLCGALVGAFVAGSLAPHRVPRLGGSSWLPGAAGMVGFAAVLAFCLPTHPPVQATATIALDQPNAAGGASGATITIAPASTVSGADYVQQLSWQGHTRSIERPLQRVRSGVYRTREPLPITGTWKSLIRVQQGRMRGDVPVYMPADAAIPAAGIPARARVTRAFVSDTSLMQRERKRDVPAWLWSAGTSIVLFIIAVLLAVIGWGLHRVGRLAGADPPPPTPGRRAGARAHPKREALGAPAGATAGARR